LTAELYRRVARADITRVDVVFARYGQGGMPAIERRLLFPLQLRSLAADHARLPPLHNLPRFSRSPVANILHRLSPRGPSNRSEAKTLPALRP
jgi:hypothetical protein